MTHFEAGQQAGEHALDDKVQGLEAIDNIFEVDCLKQVRVVRYGQREIGLLTSSEFDQL